MAEPPKLGGVIAAPQEAFYGIFSNLREHGTLRESAREPLQLVDDLIACIQLAVGAQVRAVAVGARARDGAYSAILLPRRSSDAARRLIRCFSTWHPGDGQPSRATQRDAQALHAGLPLEHAAPPIHTQHDALEDAARVAAQ